MENESKNDPPKDWEIKALKELGEIISGGTPSRSKSDLYFENGTIPWIKTLDLNNKEIISTQEKITNLGLEESSCKMLPLNTVLIAMYGGFNQIGRTGITKINATVNQAIAALIPNRDIVNSNFILHFLNANVRYWRKVAASSRKDPNITKKDVELFRVYIPPLTEQQKIAEILTTVDKKIAVVEQQIEKIQQLKKGLMQRLFTQGIGHTEFKDSKIGRIPKEWEVISLGELTIESAFGPRFSAKLYSSSGNYQCLRTTDISQDGYIDYSSIPTADLPREKFHQQCLQDGDLVITRSGSCGIVGVFAKQSMDTIPRAFLIRFRMNKKVIPWFVKHLMHTSTYQHKIHRMASGGVQKNLTGTNLKKLLLPVPQLYEQEKITTVIQSVDTKLDILNTKKHTYASLKRGLMQKLLTGQIRVKGVK